MRIEQKCTGVLPTKPLTYEDMIGKVVKYSRGAAIYLMARYNGEVSFVCLTDNRLGASYPKTDRFPIEDYPELPNAKLVLNED